MLREHREVCCLLSIIQQSMSLEADMRPMKVNVDGEAVEMQSEPLLITSESASHHQPPLPRAAPAPIILGVAPWFQANTAFDLVGLLCSLQCC